MTRPEPEPKAQEQGVTPSIAFRLFDGGFAQSEIEAILDDTAVPYESIGWDHYDNSLELHGVDDDYRMNVEVQKALHVAGFSTVYVNHKDKWETHYNFKPHESFTESKGWRVSYGHKRGDGGAILVEEVVPIWPKEWFESGKVQVKP